jgi:hypothetical protein
MLSKRHGLGMLCFALAIVLLSASVSSLGALAPGGAEQPTWVFVPMSESAQWLSAAFPDEAAAIADAFAGVSRMGTGEQGTPEVREWANYLAARSFAALTGRAPEAQLPALQPPSQIPAGLLTSLIDVELSVCVGLGARASQGAGVTPGLLVRLTGGQPLVLPQSWQVLSKLPADTWTWQPLACHVLSARQGQRNR